MFRICCIPATCAFAATGWTHLELGAGNYGPDGHTKTSQAMTVLMKIKDVLEEKNYVDNHVFYHSTIEWDAVPYIFPEGYVIDKEVGRVFHIQTADGGCLFNH